jgi:hypothetical protein
MDLKNYTKRTIKVSQIFAYRNFLCSENYDLRRSLATSVFSTVLFIIEMHFRVSPTHGAIHDRRSTQRIYDRSQRSLLPSSIHEGGTPGDHLTFLITRTR